MTWTEFKLRWRRLLAPGRAEHDLHEEINFHLAMEANKRATAGVAPDAAALRAAAAFGGTDRVLEECRDLRRFAWIEDGRRDLALGMRRLRHTPLFTLLAVGMLALAIGANTALFSLVNTVVLRPLPVPHPDQLVSLGNPAFTGGGTGTMDGEVDGLTFRQFELLQSNSPEFSAVLAQQTSPSTFAATWGTSSSARMLRGLLVSGNYFAGLGVRPALGRFFDPVESTPAAAPEAVISYGLWQSQFAGGTRVIGQRLRIHGRAFTVIGVAPRGFFGAKVGQNPQLYLPMRLQPALLPGHDLLHDASGPERTYWINVLARRKPGVSLDQARAASNVTFHPTVLEQAAEALSARQRASILTQTLPVTAIPTGLSSVSDSVQSLLVLFGLVGLILALVVVNLAGMTASQAAGRQREMGLRLALGAGRGRLVRQLLTECALVTAAAATAGLWIGRFGAQALFRLIDSQDRVVVPMDWRVFGFAAGVCMLAALGFGLWPALHLSRLQLGRPARGARLRLGRATVVAQVGAALVLVVCAALFLRSLQRLREVSLGYNPHGLTEFSVNAAGDGASPAQARATYSRLAARLAALPGVEAVTYSQNGLFRSFDSNPHISVEGSNLGRVAARTDAVAPGYFAALGVPILLGRPFSPSDDALSPAPVIIDTIMAQRYFPGASPLGRHIVIHHSNGDQLTQVIGVSGPAAQQSLRAKPVPRLYLDILAGRNSFYGVAFILRAHGDQQLPAVRSAAAAAAPGLQVEDLHSLDAAITSSIAPAIALAKIGGLFALLALLVAAMGLYAMLSFAVSRRQPEIGVRKALGASPGSIRALFLREAAQCACAGLVLGIGLALLAGRALAALLYQITPADPSSLALAAAALLAVALLAAWLPATRASRLDPLATLRQD